MQGLDKISEGRVTRHEGGGQFVWDLVDQGEELGF